MELRLIVIDLIFPEDSAELCLADVSNLNPSLGAGQLLVSDLMRRRCIPVNVGPHIHSSRLEEMYEGVHGKRYLAHGITEWLRQFPTFDALFAVGNGQYEFSPPPILKEEG